MKDLQKADKKSSKAPRIRKKALFAKIREQMEFYFSDANLHKDRFLKKSIEATSDGYISLEVFLQCNKIKVLTNDAGVIADAIDNKSQLLQINPERTHVRRVTPIKEPVNVDERTVYVECLPHDADHQWVKRLFSACGKVVYVSLPRYPSTGDLKGFGFVEFETVEGAEAACKELNNPPAEEDVSNKAGMFPKTSHQLDALRKKLPEEEITKTVEKVKEVIQTDDQEQGENVDASETVTEGQEQTKVEEVSETKTQGNEKAEDVLKTDEKSNDKGIPEIQAQNHEKTNNKETKSKRRRTNSESDSAANSDATPTKRRKSDISFDLPVEEQKTTDDKSNAGKKRSRKRKSRSKTTELEESRCESDLDKSSDVIPEKKQKLSTKSENGQKEVRNESEISAKPLDGQQSRKNSPKKKKRFRRKKDKKEKEIPELRVLPKKEWLQLRDEYLKLQKTSMAMLKNMLREQKDTGKKDLDDGKKSKKKQIEFKPDVIVKVTSDDPMRRKNLKNALGEECKIAYIDVKDEQTEGYIRCEDAESAKQIGAATIPGYIFAAVTGDEEKKYWDKLTSDRETKLNTKCRHKKRGHQKWTEKAQKASIENVERRHIVFDED